MTKEFSVRQTVIARNYTGGTKWVLSIIRAQLGPLSCEVELKSGLMWRRHTDQLRDTRILVTPSSNPLTQTSEPPIQVESRGALVSEASEQSAASNMEADFPPTSFLCD